MATLPPPPRFCQGSVLPGRARPYAIDADEIERRDFHADAAPASRELGTAIRCAARRGA